MSHCCRPVVRGAAKHGTGSPLLPPNVAGDYLLVHGGYNASDNPLPVADWKIVGVASDSSNVKVVAFGKPSLGGETTTGLAAPPYGFIAHVVRDGARVDVITAERGSGTAVTLPAIDPRTGQGLLFDAVIAMTDAGTPNIVLPGDEEVTAAANVDTVALRIGSKELADGDPVAARAATVNPASVWAALAVVVR